MGHARLGGRQQGCPWGAGGIAGGGVSRPKAVASVSSGGCAREGVGEARLPTVARGIDVGVRRGPPFDITTLGRRGPSLAGTCGAARSGRWVSAVAERRAAGSAAAVSAAGWWSNPTIVTIGGGTARGADRVGDVNGMHYRMLLLLLLLLWGHCWVATCAIIGTPRRLGSAARGGGRYAADSNNPSEARRRSLRPAGWRWVARRWPLWRDSSAAATAGRRSQRRYTAVLVLLLLMMVPSRRR